MCGIAGFIEFTQPYSDCEVLLQMQKQVSHRGPDDKGHYFHPGFGLCHTRLAVLDLTQKAHQPMRRGNLIIVYNGEIYNFKELRAELIKLGHIFQSDSDTEVALAAYQQWGKEALAKFNGMFAFAIWDSKENILFLARDRMGIKPLVYYFDGSRFVFASELRAIKVYPKRERNLSYDSLRDYFRLGYIASDNTIWDDHYRISPGEYLEINLKTKSILKKKYWEPRFEFNEELEFGESVKEVKTALIQEFQRSMISDVPVGSCISGGVDSNVLIAILAKELGHKLHTFSLGSHESKFDENRQAHAVAKYLKLNHTSLYMDPNKCRDLLIDTIHHFNVPNTDQNILSFRYIARESKKNGIPVLLSGMGGDELFFGYPSVVLLEKLEALYKIPDFLRHLIPKGVLKFSNPLYKGFQLLQQKDFLAAMACCTGNCFFDNELDRLILLQPRSAYKSSFESSFEEYSKEAKSMREKIVLWDLKNYLTNNGLYITDTSTMAEGVEMRVPYLNNRIVDVALKIPQKVKWHGKVFKALLKEIEKEYLPRELLMKEKRGFYPFDRKIWMGTFLQDLSDQYINKKRIEKQGLFRWDLIQEVIDLNRDTRVNVSSKLWGMLVFQIWAEVNL